MFEFEKVVLESQGVRISAFLGTRRLQEGFSGVSCNEVWQNYVRDRIRSEVVQVIPFFEMLEVNLYNATQAIDQEKATIELTFDVSIEIRSPLKRQQHNVKRYIGGPFDSLNEKEDFVNFLRSTGCPGFTAVRGVQVVLPSELNLPIQQDKEFKNVGLIAGIAVALVALALLAGIFLFVRTKNRRRLKAELVEDEDYGPLAQAHSEKNAYAISEIGVQTGAAVSSLGDPVVYGGVFPVATDLSTQDPGSIDYDFQQAYVDAPSISEVSGSQGGSSLSKMILPCDDSTLDAQYVAEEKFEIVVGPGVLGLILETNAADGGVPTVNNIRSSSVLANEIRIGDRLVSVDGEDVTDMFAIDVSKLIASKKDELERKLVFLRRVHVHALDDDVEK